MLLCAQYIIPIESDPFPNGALLVRDGKICDMGPTDLLKARYPDEQCLDYPRAALMPGLIDLQNHLEYSVLRGMLDDVPYAAWMSAVQACAGKLSARDWHSSAVLGGLEALTNGITCIADVSSTGASCSAMQRLGLRGVVYREVGAMDRRLVDRAVRRAENDVVRWSESVDPSRIAIGLAPREAHRCHPAVYTKVAEAARREGVPVSITIGASSEEARFLRFGASKFSVANMADRYGYVEIPPWLPSGVSPVRYVLNWGAFEADNVLAAHVSQVEDDDINKLKSYDVAVAVCARCNAQLGMGVAPLRDFMRSGLRVGLGTGYSAAIDATDMLAEARIALLIQRALNPGRFVTAESMLRLATIEAARALRMDDRVGSLKPGKLADVIAVDLSGTRQVPDTNPASILGTCSGGDVLMTMVGGDIRYEKDKWNVEVEVARDVARVIEIRGKIRE
ncbi:amidohydrolase family protein [Eggerthellaceae bacterium zg-1084]|uniref:Amidohydrolase family protein n=2 Tax=Berryella wangjianweii TaxID=2734634 RepID=A0A6M8J930_9ACTN|nr:amidohydrolase family protein [Berryella wangjianweii]NPD30582.1 amidohydrolase family protein [Berryella wangjianweii]NPD32201.1 amidohydrolase family protein [Eggerthellaceae bacterium zg-997]QKF07998.1 amidohydrolase family protein [Berryella wangjianweii]